MSSLKYSEIAKYIKESNECEEAVRKFGLDLALDKIGKSLNNYTHGNGVSYYNRAITQYIDCEIESIEKELIYQLNFITMVFLFLLILVNPSAASSDDYVDALDLDYQPIEDSQYWVAPFITEFIKKYGDLLDKDCLRFLSQATEMDL